MVRYSYKARDIDGKIHHGKVEVRSDAEFYRMLDEKGLFCITMASKNVEVWDSKKEPRMSMKSLSIFCREFSVLLASGMNLMTVLQILYEKEEKPRLKSCYMRMIEGIEKGDMLYESMKKQGNTFPQLLKAMVLAGETSGSIDLVMEKMAMYYEREATLNSKIQNALVYPVILITVTVAVVMILFTFVLPQFFALFKGRDVPAITTFFMGVSVFLTNYWYIVILILLALVILTKIAAANESVAYRIDKLILSIPVIGKLLEKIVMTHFSNAMNILYASGITIVKSLEISSEALGNRYVERKLKQVREEVEKGVTLSEAFQEKNLFNRMFTSMVHIGEESGNLENMFLKLSEYLERESQSAVEKLISILEPAILIIVAILIGSVIASVLLPLYSMYQLG